ncbi:UPF0175 family protein [Haloprofundus halobius]|uniref:UPF0175 family protein n=1 Tax=Haloprofundus halobius TaxID=2876194 RepID=UPI001CC949FD|nr:UPF0175 family protein [Haloprofundus halobius]
MTKESRSARIVAAISRYRDGEIMLGTVARFAGVNRFEMRDLLREVGVELLVLPPASSTPFSNGKRPPPHTTRVPPILGNPRFFERQPTKAQL